MASIQMRQTSSVVFDLNVENDSWGFDTENQAYVMVKNFTDGGRVVRIFSLLNMERHIQIILDADEVKAIDGVEEE